MNLNGRLVFKATILAATMLLSSILQNTALADSVMPIELKSHFYTFKKYDFSNQFNYQWVVGTKTAYHYALSSDSDFGDSSLTGGANSIYSISKLDFSDIEIPKKLSTIDIDLKYRNDSRFRITDFKSSTLESPNFETIIFISYSSSSLTYRCRYMNLISVSIPSYGTLKVDSFKRWYRSPCFPEGDALLHQSGGAILENTIEKSKSQGTLKIYLTIGDFTGAHLDSKISKTAAPLLGSLIEVETSGKERIIASGFRNPQGIDYIRSPGKTGIILSDHGPRGGDELNLIIKGRDYGWPNYSFGTKYVPNDSNNQVANTNTAKSSNLPLYAWVPSIGTSVVHQIKSMKLRTWWSDAKAKTYGDVLVAGMASQTLYRLRILDNRVIYSEPILTGLRIRTLVETKSGEFIIGADGGLRILKPVQIWDNDLGLFVDVT